MKSTCSLSSFPPIVLLLNRSQKPIHAYPSGLVVPSCVAGADSDAFIHRTLLCSLYRSLAISNAPLIRFRCWKSRSDAALAVTFSNGSKPPNHIPEIRPCHGVIVTSASGRTAKVCCVRDNREGACGQAEDTSPKEDDFAQPEG